MHLSRRTLFLYPLSLIAAAAPAKSRNDVSTAGNEFIEHWTEWANKWNSMPHGVLDVRENQMVEALPKLFARFIETHRKWMAGEP